MKNKFFNLNCLLLLFLFLIGFSPQSNSIFLHSVYADNVNSGLTNITNDGFQSALNTALNNNPISKDDTSSNIMAGIALMQSNLESIGSAMSGFALALSVVIIAIIGVKVMNSGRGDVLTFMKQRKDISNAILCIVFILIIPIFVKSVLEFKIPKFLLESVESNYTGDQYISDIIVHPSSGLVEYITEHFKSSTEDDDSTSTEDDDSNTSPETNNLLGDITINETSEMKGGLAKKLYEGVLAIIAAITYAPLLLITSVIGSIGFYPMSLDVKMYEHTIYNIVKNFFSVDSQSSVVALGTNTVVVVAGGLKSLTIVINILYSIAKKFAMLCLEVVCYYFGIMHLLNKQTENVQKFLIRVGEGVIGMLLFPYFLEFLLDIDGVISMSILRLAGDSIPGFGMLAILPPVSTANKGFCLIILSCAMAFVILMLSKSFFIRRIEILLLYIISPIFFLKHMLNSSRGSVQELLNKLLSSVFLTTVYAPVFVIISLMMSMANNPSVVTDSTGQLIYYLLILGILWMGKEVIQNIIQIFAGGSSAAASAHSQFGRGIDLSKKATKTALAMTAFGATSGAIKAHDFIKENDGIKGSAKKVEEKLKNLNQRTNQSIEKNGLPKTMGKAVVKPFKGVGKYANNMAKAKFWEKYEGAAKQFDKYTPSGANEAAMNGRENYTEREIRKKSLDSNHKKRMSDLKVKERRAEFQDYIYKKYGNDPDKARDIMNQFDKMMENNQNSKDFFENNQDFFKNADTFEQSQFVSKTTKDLIQDTKNLFNSTNKLEQEKQEAIKNGDYEKAIALESDINKNKTFFNKNANKIERAGFEELRQGERIASFKAVSSVTGTTSFIPNDVNQSLTVKDSQTVHKELNNLLHKTTDASAKQQITEFINSGVIDKKTGAVNQEGLTNLIANLNNTDINKADLTSFAEKTFTYNDKQAMSHMNLIESLSASTSQALVDRVHSGYNANNKTLQNSLSILEGNCLDKNMVRNAISNMQTTHFSNGKVPSATDISQLTADLVSKNAISQEQASQFLGSTFGCSKDDANAMIDYTIAKNIYDTNQSVVTDILQGTSITSTSDVVSNISNKLGVTEKQAQYILEHNRVSSQTPTQSQELVNRVHSGYNANNTTLQHSLSILEGNSVDKAMVNNAVSTFKTTYLSNGNVPSATDISQLTADLVSTNAISKEQAIQFLGSTFGCSQEDAHSMIDYTISKNIYDTNQSVVTDILQGTSITSTSDVVSNISNKLGVTEKQAQYVLEHNRSSSQTPTQSQKVVTKVHSGYNADNQKLRYSLSVLEGHCLDKNIVNDAVSNIQTTYLYNGDVPSAKEISQFTADLVSKNAISQEQACQFLGATFGCNKDEANIVIDYTIAKNVYDTNKDMIVKEDVVSNISNKLGVTEKQAQYVLEHNRSSSQTPTQSQKVVTKVHNGYNGDTQKLQTHLYTLEKNGLDKAVVNQVVSNFKTTHLSNGKAPSATDISQLTAELVSKNAISQEQASFFIGSTFGCNKDEASTVLDYTIAKNVYDTNKDIVVKEDVVSNLSNELGVTTKQVEYIIEYNNDTQYQHNINEFKKSNGAILDYINIEANHSIQLNTARKTAEDITIPKQVSVLHGATTFRGSNVAHAQLEQLKKETDNKEVIHRIEVVQNELSICKNNSEAEATMKQFFIKESANTDGLSKSSLNRAAQTSLGFNSNQADVHLKIFVSNNIDTSTDIGQSYKIELASYNSDSDTNVLDYLNLTDGSHKDVYNNAANNFVNDVVKNGGLLGLELSDMKDKCDRNNTPLKIADVETVITNSPKVVDDFLRNQAKTIKNGTQKVKELVSNIDDIKDNKQLTLEPVNHTDFTKRNNYTNNVEDYRGTGAINPQEFEQFYQPKPKNP